MSFRDTIKAIANTHNRTDVSANVMVHTTSGGHYGRLTDHGDALGVWDEQSKNMTWVNPDAVTAITQYPGRRTRGDDS